MEKVTKKYESLIKRFQGQLDQESAKELKDYSRTPFSDIFFELEELYNQSERYLDNFYYFKAYVLKKLFCLYRSNVVKKYLDGCQNYSLDKLLELEENCKNQLVQILERVAEKQLTIEQRYEQSLNSFYGEKAIKERLDKQVQDSLKTCQFSQSLRS